MKKTNWETTDTSLPNDNDEFFKSMIFGQKYTKNSIKELFEGFEEECDLHFEEYGSDDDMGRFLGEQFITIWKDTGNSSVSYKGKCKASFVLVESFDTKYNDEPIEIFECIYIK